MKFNMKQVYEKVKNVGDKHTFDLSDENGYAYMTDWGVPISEVTFQCKNLNQSKYVSYEYNLPLLYFMEKSIFAGQTYQSLDAFFLDTFGIKSNSRQALNHDPERSERVKAQILKNHKQNVICLDDYNIPKLEKSHSEIKLADYKFKAKMGLLSRMDKEFQEITRIESADLATIILPWKKKIKEDEGNAGTYMRQYEDGELDP